MRDLTDHYQTICPLDRWAAMTDDQFYYTPWVRRAGVGHLAFGFIPVFIITEVMPEATPIRPANMGDLVSALTPGMPEDVGITSSLAGFLRQEAILKGANIVSGEG
jgi:hypothetical protein